MRKRKRPFGRGGLYLEAYLVRNGISLSKAAKILEISQDFLLSVIAGRVRPETDLRLKISSLTENEVPVTAWGGPALREVLSAHLRPPKTRGDCVDGERPCPYLNCRYHLWNDIKLKHMPDGLPEESCALDVAEEGDHTLLDISYFLLLTRERVRQVEHMATTKLSRRLLLMRED